MSLNDEVLNDIEQPELVDEDKNMNEPVLDIDSVNSAIESFNNVISKVSKLTSIKSFKANLLKANSVSRIDIKNYVSMFGDENNKIAIEEYTNVSSKTNFDKTIRLIDNVISLEEEYIQSSFNEFISTPMTNCISVLEQLSTVELDNITNQLNEIQNNNYAFLQEGYKFKDFVVMYDNQPVNILDIDIESLDIMKVKLNDSELEDNAILANAFGNIQKLFKLNIFKVFFMSCINNDDIKNMLLDPNYAEYLNKPITLNDILTFHKTNVQINYNGILKESMDSTIKEWKLLSNLLNNQDDSTSSAVNNKNLIENVISKEKNVTSMLIDTTNLVNIMYGYKRVILNSTYIFNFLNKL